MRIKSVVKSCDVSFVCVSETRMLLLIEDDDKQIFEFNMSRDQGLELMSDLNELTYCKNG